MFFVKYPNFKKNPFYITGESYAGIHIPLLARNIYKAKSTINLKGVAIGNGQECPCDLLVIQVEWGSTPNPYNIYDDCDAIKLNKQTRSASLDCPHNGYTDYLNNADVRKALHVHPDAPNWSDCSGFYAGDYEPMHKTTLDILTI
ncbi:unnamed protein product, partial [Oppiella nova]